MARKLKTLPADFDALLAAGDIDALKAVYATRLLDARGGPLKYTALGFEKCPEELVRWLVGQGLDVDTPNASGSTPLATHVVHGRALVPLLLELGADVHSRDNWGRTPLHEAVRHPATVGLLLAHGADPNAAADHGETPLYYAGPYPETVRLLLAFGADVNAVGGLFQRNPLQQALSSCNNPEIPGTAESVRLLLEAGSLIPGDTVDWVTALGKRYEFVRADRDAKFVERADAAMAELYEMFGVPPVAHRRMHDGVAPITVTETSWQGRFNELWELLVPASGEADTVQGEAIRLSGKISHELLDNGGANWGPDYREMTEQLIGYLQTGTAVASEAELAHLRSQIGMDADDEDIDRLAELTVAWVLANPNPEPL